MAGKISIKSIKNIWLLSREYEGLAGAGGIKDVCCQLAEALARSRRSVSVLLPLYGCMDPDRLGFVRLAPAFAVDMSYVGLERREAVAVWSKKINGVSVYLADAERYRSKNGIYTYTAEEEKANPLNRQGDPYFDYFAMNVLLQKAALNLIITLNEKPDIIHCHDGHTAILPAIMREAEGFRQYFRQTGAVVTIHNAGLGYHQDIDDLAFVRAVCGLPDSLVATSLLNGRFNPFLAAADYAVINTVSENYARELQESDDDALTGWLGHQLLRRGIRLAGITNGIDPADFDPGRPDREQTRKLGLPAVFDPGRRDLAGKKTCKEVLLRMIGRKEIIGSRQVGSLDFRPEQPLFTMVGRLNVQKGIDILVGALAEMLLLDRNFQVLIQGSGPRDLENAMAGLAEKKENRGRVCLFLGYDQLLANRIFAAGDFFLLPSKYEPCGLTDYIAQLAGNIPIVRHVGGLVKVKDGVTGLAFADYTAGALVKAMQRALRLFREQPGRLTDMQEAAVRNIREHHTWDTAVKHYLELYLSALPLGRSDERERAREPARFELNQSAK